MTTAAAAPGKRETIITVDDIATRNVRVDFTVAEAQGEGYQRILEPMPQFNTEDTIVCAGSSQVGV